MSMLRECNLARSFGRSDPAFLGLWKIFPHFPRTPGVPSRPWNKNRRLWKFDLLILPGIYWRKTVLGDDFFRIGQLNFQGNEQKTSTPLWTQKIMGFFEERGPQTFPVQTLKIFSYSPSPWTPPLGEAILKKTAVDFWCLIVDSMLSRLVMLTYHFIFTWWIARLLPTYFQKQPKPSNCRGEKNKTQQLPACDLEDFGALQSLRNSWN